MDILHGSEIADGLRGSKRVYLCGDLKWSNGVRHIPTDGYEIGISHYRQFTFEQAHLHSYNREFNYVMEGSIKIFLLREEKEYEFHAGDLFVINVDEPYVGKSAPGTRVIFSKVPGGNDKVLVPMSDALLHWGSSWESRYGEA